MKTWTAPAAAWNLPPPWWRISAGSASTWQEGPDVGGPHAPYRQSERLPHYRALFERLIKSGHVYPCHCSRQDVLRALSAPHAGDEEPVYPGTCRERPPLHTPGASWRFRVPDGEVVGFHDGRLGWQEETAGRDFGDFVVWRKDDFPSYQLAVVADDHAMQYRGGRPRRGPHHQHLSPVAALPRAWLHATRLVPHPAALR